VFDGWMDIFQVGVEGEAFEVARVGLGERTGEVGMLFECGDVHEMGLDMRADLFAELGKDVEAAVIHV